MIIRQCSRLGFLCLVLFGWDLPLAGAESMEFDGQTYQLDAFVIYETPIDVIDGFSGEKYDGDNPVVLDFADTFNDLLLGFHKKLLINEINHLKFRLEDGLAFEKDLGELAASFGIKGFDIDHNRWLVKEKSILYRLNTEPFYKIDAMIVWDVDKLNRMLPNKPDNKYARDIHYNQEKGIWERRVTTHWKVSYMRPSTNRNSSLGKPVNIEKFQGLNLDTNEGYHFIDHGLSNDVPPHAFKDVKLTYPVLINSTEPREEQVRRLQETFVENLIHIYDPFSWGARRDTRFRRGFYREISEAVDRTRFKFKDEKWFNAVLARLLSDVITVKHHGTKEIYSLYALQRFHLSPNILGKDLDLLNWNKGEKRKGTHDGADAKVFINFKNPNGARFIVLDAYMRYSGKFVDALRSNIAHPEKNESGQDLFKRTIEEVSGAPWDFYEKNAIKAQKAMIEKYR
jgi:hypothetical protein